MEAVEDGIEFPNRKYGHKRIAVGSFEFEKASVHAFNQGVCDIEKETVSNDFFLEVGNVAEVLHPLVVEEFIICETAATKG